MASVNKQLYHVFYGWWIVAACVFIAAYINGIITYGFTAFIGPLVQEFGWSYVEISIAASIRGLEGGLFSPVVGYFVDHWDAKKIMLVGVTVVGLGLLFLSQVNSLWTFYGVFFLICVGLCMISPVLPAVVVSKWFKRNLATVMGIVACGGVLGGLMLPLITQLIEILNWRVTLIIFGMGALCILLPVSFVVRSSPEKYNYLPDGETISKISSSKIEKALEIKEVHTNFEQVLRGRAFWQISVAVTLVSLISSSMVVHIMPYLNSIGVARSISSLFAGALPLVSILGRLFSGWLGDRIDKRKVASACMFIIGLAMLIVSYFYSVLSSWLLVVFVVLFAVGWGGYIPMHMALLREYFVGDKFGTILGISLSVTYLGTITGPLMAAWAFDSFNTYQYCWFALMGIAIAAGVVVLTIPSLNKFANTR